MVRKDRNHPCVVLYSTGNEIPDGSKPAGLQVGRALAEKVRALDDTRLVTQAVSGMMVGGPEVFAELRATADAPAVDEAGINTTLTTLADIMDRAMTHRGVTDVTDRGVLAPRRGWLQLHGPALRARRRALPAAASSCRASPIPPPPSPDDGPASSSNPHVIGEFTWTGWDYLGEVGIGRVEYGEPNADVGMTGFHGEYPWRTAWCGDIDITGHRRPQSHYREIVFGLRDRAVHRRPAAGAARQSLAHSSPWAFDDVVASWGWPDHEDRRSWSTSTPMPTRSSSSSPAPRWVASRPAPSTVPGPFETTYRPGTVEAVAWRGGEETGRASLTSPTGDGGSAARRPSEVAPTRPTWPSSRSRWSTAPARSGPRPTGWWRSSWRVRRRCRGSPTAAPSSEEPFTGSSCTTFQGRAIAVVRPHGAGTITLTTTAEGTPPDQTHPRP